ncbi:MAG: CAP domain-containing protein [Clostridiales bacterium]|nr:CAP domain-containing protein [Clostridiales bacterium]
MKHTAKIMKHLSAPVLALALLCLPAFQATGTADAAFDAHYTSAFLSAQEQSAGNLLNSDRARYGLPALTLDPELCRIARIKSQDMRDNQYFSHTSPTYGDVRAMLRHFGYAFEAAGENIAHHRDVEKAQAALISSPAHRRNLLSSAYTRAGIGIVQDKNGIYLTQIFCR